MGNDHLSPFHSEELVLGDIAGVAVPNGIPAVIPYDCYPEQYLFYLPS